MRTILCAGVLVATLSGSAAGQCCGDCNGDGTVAINELITAVNNALTNCGAPTVTPLATSTPTPRPTATPTPSDRCPFRLDEDEGGACAFRGRFNRACGNALDSLLTTNGSTVVVAIDTMLPDPQSTVWFAADVVDETRAALALWSTDNFETANVTSGDLELTDSGENLVIFPNTPPFAIQSCSFVIYEGEYTGRFGASLGDADASAALFERIRVRRARPIPDLANMGHTD